MISRLPSLLNSFERGIMEVKKKNVIQNASVNNYLSSISSEDDLKLVFSDAYAMIQPMFEVGGDGFWLHQSDEYTCLVVFDCMGHGHLATMMTTIYLEEIKNCVLKCDLSDPSSILSLIHQSLKDAFENNDKLIDTGADIGVIVLNNHTKDIYYSGAKIDLFVMEGSKLLKIKADRKTVGEYFDIPHSYCTHEIKYKKNVKRKFYLFSDGITDVIGGPRGKRLGTANFSQLLESLNGDSLEDEKSKVKAFINRWAGANAQPDDQMLVCFRVD